MPSPLTRRTLAFAACLLSAAAAGGTQTGVTSVAAPGGAEAGMYSLAPEGDGAVLGWLEPSAGGRAFRFSFYRGGRWSTPQTIAEGPDLFANWAGHPSIVSTGDGSLVAQWPVVNPGKPAPARTTTAFASPHRATGAGPGRRCSQMARTTSTPIAASSLCSWNRQGSVPST